MTGNPINPKQLTPGLLRRLIDYDPETGQTTWRMRSPDMFEDGVRSRETKCMSWNAKNANRPALAYRSKNGYLRGSVVGVEIMAHRVAWVIHFGEWPDALIDHINGEKSDNRIINLRLASRSENSRNRCRNSNNRSGVTGVHWINRDSCWKALICVDGQTVCLGYFSSKQLAAAARRRAERKYGFTIRRANS